METYENDVIVETVEEVKAGSSPELAKIEIEDRGGFVWGIIGFLAPVIGLILHLVMRKSLPKNASALKKGVITGLIVIAVLIIVYAIAISSLVSAIESTMPYYY